MMAEFCHQSILLYVVRMTYDPGLGETEEFPNLSERVGVELEVVLLVSYIPFED